MRITINLRVLGSSKAASNLSFLPPIPTSATIIIIILPMSKSLHYTTCFIENFLNHHHSTRPLFVLPILSSPCAGHCSFTYFAAGNTRQMPPARPLWSASYYMELMRRRSFLRAFNFAMASFNGISLPFACVSWSSRLRMFTERDSFSCAPTTSSC